MLKFLRTDKPVEFSDLLSTDSISHSSSFDLFRVVVSGAAVPKDLKVPSVVTGLASLVTSFGFVAFSSALNGAALSSDATPFFSCGPGL